MLDIDVLNRDSEFMYAVNPSRIKACTLDGKIVFYKDFDIKEFIGEELSRVVGVRSAHYIPICLADDYFEVLKKKRCDREDFLKTGSLDFRQNGVIYKTRKQLFDEGITSLDMLLESCSDSDKKTFYDEKAKMLALDIYSAQFDRRNNEMFEIHPNGEVHLSPLFDYQYSLESVYSGNLFYSSDFHFLANLDDYYLLLEEYPKLREYLSLYLGVDLEKIIIEMCERRGFDFSKIDMGKFKRFDEGTHKKLEKILR